jgi:transposase
LESGNYKLTEITSMYHVDKTTIKSWKYNFEIYGMKGLQNSTTCKRYSKELKLLAIEDALSDQYSLREVAKKYEVFQIKAF